MKKTHQASKRHKHAHTHCVKAAVTVVGSVYMNVALDSVFEINTTQVAGYLFADHDHKHIQY